MDNNTPYYVYNKLFNLTTTMPTPQYPYFKDLQKTVWPLFNVLTYSKNGGPIQTIKWDNNDTLTPGNVHDNWNAIKALTLDSEGCTAFILHGFNAPHTDSVATKYNCISGLSSDGTYMDVSNSVLDVNDSNPIDFSKNASSAIIDDGYITFTSDQAGFRWSENTLTIYPARTTLSPNYVDAYSLFCETQEQVDAATPIVIRSCGVVEPKNHIHVETSTKILLPTDILSNILPFSVTVIIDRVTRTYLIDTLTPQGSLELYRLIQDLNFNGAPINKMGLNNLYFRTEMTDETINNTVQLGLTVTGCNTLEYNDTKEITIPTVVNNIYQPLRLKPTTITTARRVSNKITFIKKAVNGYVDLFTKIVGVVGDEHVVYSSAKIPCAVVQDVVDAPVSCDGATNIISFVMDDITAELNYKLQIGEVTFNEDYSEDLVQGYRYLDGGYFIYVIKPEIITDPVNIEVFHVRDLTPVKVKISMNPDIYPLNGHITSVSTSRNPTMTFNNETKTLQCCVIPFELPG